MVKVYLERNLGVVQQKIWHGKERAAVGNSHNGNEIICIKYYSSIALSKKLHIQFKCIVMCIPDGIVSRGLASGIN